MATAAPTPTPEELAAMKALLESLAFSSFISKACTLSGWVICLFDWLVCFDREVELFWTKPWSVAKGLYAFNRYGTMALLGFHTLMFYKNDLTDAGCLAWFKSEASTGIVAIIGIEAILAFRVYALWNRSRVILGVLVFALLAQVASMGTVLGITYTTMTAVLEPTVQVCIPLNVNPHFFTFWFPPLAFECLALVLALIRGYKNFTLSTKNTGARLMDIVLRDSLVYFLVVLSVDLTSALVWVKGPAELLQAIVGHSLAVPSALGARLLLNIREAYYVPETYLQGTYDPAIEMPIRVIKSKAKRPPGDSLWSTGDLDTTKSRPKRNSSFGQREAPYSTTATALSVNIQTQVEYIREEDEDVQTPKHRYTFSNGTPTSELPLAFPGQGGQPTQPQLQQQQPQQQYDQRPFGSAHAF